MMVEVGVISVDCEVGKGCCEHKNIKAPKSKRKQERTEKSRQLQNLIWIQES